MMAIGSVFFCHILFFSFLANNPFGYGATATNCSGPKGGVYGRHGSCLPPTPSQKKSSLAATSTSRTQMLLQDERRVQVINSHRHNRGVRNVDESVNPFFGNFVGSSDYLVKVGFGTPVKYFSLILDTGSDITWVNCQPCLEAPCTQQTENSQYYDPSFSNTSSWNNNNKHFNQSYLDNSSANGFLVNDTLTIPPSDDDTEGSPDVYSNFSFLCAQNKQGDFDGADGILGLGKAGSEYGDYSFISQTSTKSFCHCIPSTGVKGYLYFGKEALEKCQNSATYTPLLSNPSDPSYYYVKLIAITIGQKRLPISSSSSSFSSSPSTIMDSGTVITRLPSLVYSALKSEFRELMSGYPLADPDVILDTCYNLQGYGHNVTIPDMVLHFEKLDVNLTQTQITSKGPIKGMSQVCLAFAAKRDENDFTIIGNHQMQKLNMLYNIQDQRVEIGPGNC